VKGLLVLCLHQASTACLQQGEINAVLLILLGSAPHATHKRTQPQHVVLSEGGSVLHAGPLRDNHPATEAAVQAVPARKKVSRKNREL